MKFYCCSSFKEERHQIERNLYQIVRISLTLYHRNPNVEEWKIQFISQTALKHQLIISGSIALTAYNALSITSESENEIHDGIQLFIFILNRSANWIHSKWKKNMKNREFSSIANIFVFIFHVVRCCFVFDWARLRRVLV